MATKAKDPGTSLRKEKKATPPSNPKPAPAATDKDKSSAKPVPNYLKPTFSSRSESVKYVKKINTSEDPNQKLIRRRSFDRPPSAQKSPDPKERIAPRDRLIPNRPSSSSSASRTHSTSAVYRPVLDRNAKSLKPVRPNPQQQPNAALKTMSRSKSLTKNSHPSESVSPQHVTQDHSDAQTKQDIGNESLVQEAGEVLDVNVERDEAQFERNDEHVNVKELDDHIEDEKLQNSTVEDQVEVNEVELAEPDEDDHIHQVEESKSEQLPDHEEAHVEDCETEKIKEHVEENLNEKAAEEVVEDPKGESNEEMKSKDEESVNEEKNNGEAGRNNGEMQKKQGTPAAYNDVIEVTKNKLLEKRKNKVKALVGAFETVIDYETAAGSNK